MARIRFSAMIATQRWESFDAQLARKGIAPFRERPLFVEGTVYIDAHSLYSELGRTRRAQLDRKVRALFTGPIVIRKRFTRKGRLSSLTNLAASQGTSVMALRAAGPGVAGRIATR